jgi:hypothetical protein
MSVIDIPELKSDLVTLRPFQDEADVDYAVKLSLQYKYCKLSENQIRQAIQLYSKVLWNGFVGDKKIGFIAINKYQLENMSYMFTFDAYKDREATRGDKNSLDYSYHAGDRALRWVLNNITPVIFSAPQKQNRAAIYMLKRLGFVKVKETESVFGSFVVFKKEKA